MDIVPDSPTTRPLGIAPDLDPDELASIGAGASARHVDPRDVPQPNTWAPEDSDISSLSPYRQPPRGPVQVAAPVQVMPGAYRVLAAENRTIDTGEIIHIGLQPSRVQAAQVVAYSKLSLTEAVLVSADRDALPSMWAHLNGDTHHLDGIAGLWIKAIANDTTVGILVIGV